MTATPKLRLASQLSCYSRYSSCFSNARVAPHAHTTPATTAVATGHAAPLGCCMSALPLADASPTNEYRFATGQIEINKLKKKNPRPAPADAPRAANIDEKNVITTIMSRASIVQIDTDATNGPNGDGPKIARVAGFTLERFPV